MASLRRLFGPRQVEETATIHGGIGRELLWPKMNSYLDHAHHPFTYVTLKPGLMKNGLRMIYLRFKLCSSTNIYPELTWKWTERDVEEAASLFLASWASHFQLPPTQGFSISLLNIGVANQWLVEPPLSATNWKIWFANDIDLRNVPLDWGKLSGPTLQYNHSQLETWQAYKMVCGPPARSASLYQFCILRTRFWGQWDMEEF